MASKKKQGGSLLKKAIIILVVLVVLGGGGYIGYEHFFKNKIPPVQSLTKVRLKPELIIFAYEKMPGLYPRLAELNDEIALIDREMERLNELSTLFPAQHKIIGQENKLWSTTLKELTQTLTAIEKEIETVYVTYLVNEEKGRQLIVSQEKPLVEAAQSALNTSSAHTQRLKAKPPQGLIENIKQKLFN